MVSSLKRSRSGLGRNYKSHVRWTGKTRCSNTTTAGTGDATFPPDEDRRIINIERYEKHISLCEVFGESLRGATDVELVLPRIDASGLILLDPL